MPGEYELLRTVLSDRIIAFHPQLARAFGGVNEAILFQQLAYWSDKGADPEWIYKTQKDIEAETTLTRTQQENARAKLRRLGVIEEDKRGVPAKLYYRVVWKAVFELLEAKTRAVAQDAGNPQPSLQGGPSQDAGNLQPRMREIPLQDAGNLHPSLRETTDQDRGKPASQRAGNLPSITESTQEKTTERDFEVSKSRPIDFDLAKARTELLPFMEDFAREFRDEAPIRSSVTRAVNLYVSSGVDMDTYVGTLYTARAKTKEWSASIEKKASGGRQGSKNAMPYFFAIVADLLGVEEPQRRSG